MKSEEMRKYLEDVTAALRAVILADAKNVAFGGSKLPSILRNLQEEVLAARLIAKRLKAEEQSGKKSPNVIFVSSGD